MVERHQRANISCYEVQLFESPHHALFQISEFSRRNLKFFNVSG